MKKLAIVLLLTLALSGTAHAQESPFSDLSPDHPGYDTVMNLVGMGIVDGYPDGTVKLDQNITRAELLKIIIEGMGLAPHPLEYNRCFEDVTITHDWYIGYVCYGKEEGWVVGYSDGTFKPGNNINNVEILSMIFNAYGLSMPEWYRIDTVLDDVSVNDWYAPYIQYASKNDIIDLNEHYYYPGAIITRIEAFEILERTLGYIESLSEEVEFSTDNLSFTHTKFYTQGPEDSPLFNEFLLFTKDNDDGIAFISESALESFIAEFDMSFEDLVKSFPSDEMEGSNATLKVASGKIENILDFNEYIDDNGEGLFVFMVLPVTGTGESYYVVAHYLDEETRDELLEMFSSIEVK